MSARIQLATGTRVGRWTVLREAAASQDGRSRSLCECSCGTVKSVPVSSLRSPTGSRSCGCARNDTLREQRFQRGEQLVGTKIGKRTIRAYEGKNRHGTTLVRVKCDCGTESVVTYNALTAGRADQCPACHYAESPPPHAKLTAEEARVIRKLATSKAMKQSAIADLFNVSQATVSNIKRGHIWRQTELQEN